MSLTLDRNRLFLDAILEKESEEEHKTAENNQSVEKDTVSCHKKIPENANKLKPRLQETTPRRKKSLLLINKPSTRNKRLRRRQKAQTEARRSLKTAQITK